MEFAALGKSGVNEPTDLLETFETTKRLSSVRMISDEVTSCCPVSGQPDWYTVEIEYHPDKLCIESKSLKLKLQSYRNKGIFCEQLSVELLDHVLESISPLSAKVTVTQKSRGGVSIVAQSDWPTPVPESWKNVAQESR